MFFDDDSTVESVFPGDAEDVSVLSANTSKQIQKRKYNKRKKDDHDDNERGKRFMGNDTLNAVNEPVFKSSGESIGFSRPIGTNGAYVGGNGSNHMRDMYTLQRNGSDGYYPSIERYSEYFKANGMRYNPKNGSGSQSVVVNAPTVHPVTKHENGFEVPENVSNKRNQPIPSGLVSLLSQHTRQPCNSNHRASIQPSRMQKLAAMEELYERQCGMINGSESDHTTGPSSSDDSIHSSLLTSIATDLRSYSRLSNSGQSISSGTDSENSAQARMPARGRGRISEPARAQQHLPEKWRDGQAPTASDMRVLLGASSFSYEKVGLKTREVPQDAMENESARRRSPAGENPFADEDRVDDDGDLGFYDAFSESDGFFRIDTDLLGGSDLFGSSSQLGLNEDDDVDDDFWGQK
mmetsp:Transcript_24537/g.36116  ORF Transcript_24537/g.36116 Transcript_24537/m.36116 type:complete len:408 (+) Transcript_24537:272-1495(+)|eukprot:CAMPEP_0185020522 /NCGR_PEP_ID=MMETSP1103-20130426/3125_1 /TAXON_ID=36769 /ORGANISM="Paraphysomonas bandaiensis, Strain Caron Lab Isolate" /LENGTH=407 /DNA_ID=CAMNT_0027551469 /DNA_START=175 /DNA_END=1398 /DNA_ORIENTATION=+